MCIQALRDFLSEGKDVTRGEIVQYLLSLVGHAAAWCGCLCGEPDDQTQCMAAACYAGLEVEVAVAPCIVKAVSGALQNAELEISREQFSSC